MATEDAAPAAEPEARGIDAWMRRYSRWRERRLTHLAAVPLSSLAVQNLFLCVCILLDGVFVPWIVVVVMGSFSYVLFALLLVPSFVVEAFLYKKLKARDASAP